VTSTPHRARFICGRRAVRSAGSRFTLDLADRLAEHAAVRGARWGTDRLLRYRDGRALTSRRYDHLWYRVGEQLPWAAVQGISTHWLRHTTLTWVERHFGYGVARVYAGHTDSHGAATTTYIKADLPDVAAALAALTGQPHPLAERPGQWQQVFGTWPRD
jgi:integrase